MDSKVLFYDDGEEYVTCRVCPHNCKLSEGKFGICRVRVLKPDGPLAINYGEVTSMGVDPIEKKPLYHYKPSKNILSIGSFGCNMTCSFCQNYEISQGRPKTQYVSIEELINTIPTVQDNIGVAFTYNEPLMWYEYIYDAARAIKKKNDKISVVIVTNGYINEEPLMKLLPCVDAMNIDLKGYTNRYYNKVCGAKLEPVLETIKRVDKHCHVEITTLLVRDENDSIDEAGEIAKFIASVNEEIPLHLSRYFPRYKMENAATKIKSITNAREEALKYLKYVYIGNVENVDNNTYCPNCNKSLVKRNGYSTEVLIRESRCGSCGKEINIVL